MGVHLQRARLGRKWTPTDVERAGGPSYKTVQAIENGDAGHVKSVAQCATALSLSLPDILYAILAERETPLSPEAAHLVQQFNATTIAGRTALLAMATALPPAASPGGTAKPAPAAPRKPSQSRSVLRATKPRTDE